MLPGIRIGASGPVQQELQVSLKMYQRLYKEERNRGEIARGEMGRKAGQNDTNLSPLSSGCCDSSELYRGHECRSWFTTIHRRSSWKLCKVTVILMICK